MTEETGLDLVVGSNKETGTLLDSVTGTDLTGAALDVVTGAFLVGAVFDVIS